jgi:hypothetical protein
LGKRHTVEGRGGATAPEIIYFGDEDPERVVSHPLAAMARL